MTCPVLPVTGYLDRLSLRPGESLSAHVATHKPCSYRARLVRVISADPNPAGPGLQFEDMSCHFDTLFDGLPQPIRLGSYGFARIGDISRCSQVTWTALAWMAADIADYRTVLSHEDKDANLTMRIGSGGLRLELGDVTLALETEVEPRVWYRIWAALDRATGRLSTGMSRVSRPEDMASVAVDLLTWRQPFAGAVLVGARDADAHRDHFEGKIEDPALAEGFLADWPDPLMPLENLPGLLFGWDFSRVIGSQVMVDAGPTAANGLLINLPMDAVRGARWTGEEMCWRHRPDHYAAAHFHSDDIGDLAWPSSFTWSAPQDLESGSYAFHLQCDEGEDWLPFYVRAPRGATGRPPIVFLASTLTYQAYANHARGNFDDAFRARVAEWGAYPYNADDFPIYGRSTYNRHPDGSGIAYSTRLRPMLTMRPGYLTFNDPNGSGLRHYSADSHLLAWLEAKEISFDIVTDEDLHEEGVQCLDAYRLLITGTHPEYHTSQTWDAVHQFTRQGGRLAYLGGNGFYWRVGRNSAQPGMLEMRRSEGGTRAWASEPGEYYNALDGKYGGMWRRNGKDPQSLVGVGFSGQAAFEATYFRRLDGSKDEQVSWMFDGVGGDVIGDYGLSAGGAAGFEFDRADTRLGTPHNTVLLATSVNPPATFFPVMEELLGPKLALDGGNPERLIRADMVYFTLPGGGAVFSVGSITFCGSLWRDGFEGPVSRLLENVVAGLASSILPGSA